MQIYAVFSDEGLPEAFYPDEIFGARVRPVLGPADEETGLRPVIGEEPNPECRVPAEAVPIAVHQYRDFLSHPGERKWQDGNVIAYEPPPAVVTGEDVNAERYRRIVVGKIIDGVHVTGTEEDARNLTSLALVAQLRLAANDTETLTTFRDGGNVDHQLTPSQVLSLWQQSAAYVSALYAASWALKAMEPIPADYAADTYWSA
jgi:hypothetical protein